MMWRRPCPQQGRSQSRKKKRKRKRRIRVKQELAEWPVPVTG
jgi:hypothetical protein